MMLHNEDVCSFTFKCIGMHKLITLVSVWLFWRALARGANRCIC